MTDEMLRQIEQDLDAMNIQALPPVGASIEVHICVGTPMGCHPGRPGGCEWKRGTVTGYLGSPCEIQVTYDDGSKGSTSYGYTPKTWR